LKKFSKIAETFNISIYFKGRADEAHTSFEEQFSHQISPLWRCNLKSSVVCALTICQSVRTNGLSQDKEFRYMKTRAVGQDKEF